MGVGILQCVRYLQRNGGALGLAQTTALTQHCPKSLTFDVRHHEEDKPACRP